LLPKDTMCSQWDERLVHDTARKSQISNFLLIGFYLRFEDKPPLLGFGSETSRFSTKIATFRGKIVKTPQLGGLNKSTFGV
jgi:hypothetical protein